MSHLNIKQLKGPQSGSSGAAIVFDAGKPAWSDNLSSALLLPRGNTAARPSSASNGMLRYNNQTNKLEAFEAGAWKSVISDSELLRRYSIKVTFDSGGKFSGVSEMPTGWTATMGPSANEFYLMTNVGKQPFDFTVMGLQSLGGTTYVSRPKSAQLVMAVDMAIPEKIAFGGLSTSFMGTVAGGHAYMWIYF